MNVHDPTVIQPSSPSRNPCGEGVRDAVLMETVVPGGVPVCTPGEPADHPGQLGSGRRHRGRRQDVERYLPDAGKGATGVVRHGSEPGAPDSFTRRNIHAPDGIGSVGT